MIQSIAIFGGYAALCLACLGLLCIALQQKPKMDPMEECRDRDCRICHPKPARKAQRERFGDADCRTDWDVAQEARRLHRQAVDRAEKAWLN